MQRHRKVSGYEALEVDGRVTLVGAGVGCHLPRVRRPRPEVKSGQGLGGGLGGPDGGALSAPAGLARKRSEFASSARRGRPRPGGHIGRTRRSRRHAEDVIVVEENDRAAIRPRYGVAKRVRALVERMAVGGRRRRPTRHGRAKSRIRSETSLPLDELAPAAWTPDRGSVGSWEHRQPADGGDHNEERKEAGEKEHAYQVSDGDGPRQGVGRRRLAGDSAHTLRTQSGVRSSHHDRQYQHQPGPWGRGPSPATGTSLPKPSWKYTQPRKNHGTKRTPGVTAPSPARTAYTSRSGSRALRGQPLTAPPGLRLAGP